MMAIRHRMLEELVGQLAELREQLVEALVRDGVVARSAAVVAGAKPTSLNPSSSVRWRKIFFTLDGSRRERHARADRTRPVPREQRLHLRRHQVVAAAAAR